MGDVLRSTALLPPLAEAHPRAAITWITRKESVPLLQRNPYIAEVLELGPEAIVHLQTRTFDRVINLDASKISAALAASAIVTWIEPLAGSARSCAVPSAATLLAITASPRLNAVSVTAVVAGTCSV